MRAGALGGAHVIAVLKDSQDFWVHLNETILLLEEPLIANRNLTLDPFLERCTDDREHDVDDKLPRKFRNFRLDRQMGIHLRVGLGELQYVHSCQTLKLGDVQNPNFIRLNVLLGASR